MAVWPNSILSPVMTKENTLGIYKKHLKDTYLKQFNIWQQHLFIWSLFAETYNSIFLFAKCIFMVFLYYNIFIVLVSCCCFFVILLPSQNNPTAV